MALLSFQNASVRFGGVSALDRVSFEVEEASVTGLIGPNGAGKTTAFNLISRLHHLDSGDVVFDGRSLLRVPPRRVIRLGIARTFQNLELFPRMTALENVLVGAHAASRFRREGLVRRRALEALEYLGVEQFADRPAAWLSFGTRKRVELARALVSRPRLLLLDEPTGGLSEGAVERVTTVIRRLRDEQRLTIVLVEHNLGVVMAVSDRVHVLNSGRLIASGTPAEVASNPGVVEAYIGGSRRGEPG